VRKINCTCNKLNLSPQKISREIFVPARANSFCTIAGMELKNEFR